MPNLLGVRPSFATGFAQGQGESEYPELWRGLVAAYDPSLGQTGSRLIDWSGKLNHGTFGADAASPSWVMDKFGWAISYGGDDYIDTGVKSLPGTSLFCDSSQKFSVIVSFNIASGISGTFIAKAGAVGGIRTFQIYTAGGSNLLIYLRGFNNKESSGFISGIVGDGKNHIVVVTWDGTIARCYLDGSYLIDLQVGAAVEETTENIIFGARTGGTGYYLIGIEDFVSIYNRALIPAEISLLHQLRKRVA